MPAIALGAWILLTPAMFSGGQRSLPSRLHETVGRPLLEATIVRRAKLRMVHALLERRSRRGWH